MSCDVIQIRNPIERDFTMVPNRLWSVPGLSVTAKAVFAYLLSWRDGSAVRVAVIEDALSIGRDARRAAFKQLEAAGLLRIEVKNLDRGRFVTLRTVDATPLLTAPGPENPSTVPPGPEKPSPVNQAVKGRISTPAPPENPSPYKDKMKTKGGADAATARPVHRQPRRLPLESGGASVAVKDEAVTVAKLSPFQRKQVREGQRLVLDGQPIAAGSPLMLTLQAALSDLERGTAKRDCPAPKATAALVGAVASAWEKKGAGHDARS